MGKYAKILLALLGALVISGCSGLMPREQITNLDEVGADEVVLVGKVAFNPPLTPQEQHLSDSWNFAYAKNKVANRFFLTASENYEHIRTGSMRGSDSYTTTLGETFYIKAKSNKPFYISGGLFYTNLDNKRMETMTYNINDGLKVAPSRSKALYIGTITFFRDEFFNIKNIDISQKDFAAESRRFNSKFGSKYKLVKAKLSSAQ